MKKVIWGAGSYATKYINSLENDDIMFFIDSNEKKWGTKYLEKDVKSPGEIEDWNELYIYIQYNYYEEISAYLVEKGLMEGKNFEKYGDSRERKYVNIKEQCKKSLESLRCRNDIKEKTLYWYGIMVAREREFNGIKAMLHGKVEWLFALDETLDTKSLSECEEMSHYFKFPLVCSGFSYPSYQGEDFLVREHIEAVKNSKELYAMAQHYRAEFPELLEDYEYECIYIIDGYIREVFDILQPRRVFIFHSFQACHLILGMLCRERNIPFMYTHPGCIPGTCSYDVSGEMGESLPAICSEQFRNLPVSEDELKNAQRVCEYIRNNKINRKLQPKNDLVKGIQGEVKREWPVILVCGQNDPLTGMGRYNENSGKYHSPMFDTSLEAAVYIGTLAEKKNWNVVFKPHPHLQLSDMQIRSLPDSVHFVEQADINELIDMSDVIVTIVSTSSYDALFRDKPVVMLGYNQLREKGCTYDAFTLEQIETQIDAAIQNGYTEEQKEAFIMHAAQLLKYYLYDDLTEREIRYGRTMPQDISEFYELSELLGGEWTQI